MALFVHERAAHIGLRLPGNAVAPTPSTAQSPTLPQRRAMLGPGVHDLAPLVDRIAALVGQLRRRAFDMGEASRTDWHDLASGRRLRAELRPGVHDPPPLASWLHWMPGAPVGRASRA